jgi:hypothetical protein
MYNIGMIHNIYVPSSIQSYDRQLQRQRCKILQTQKTL